MQALLLRQRILNKRLGQQHGDATLLLEQNSVTEKIKDLRENISLTQQVRLGDHFAHSSVGLAWHYSWKYPESECRVGKVFVCPDADSSTTA